MVLRCGDEVRPEHVARNTHVPAKACPGRWVRGRH